MSLWLKQICQKRADIDLHIVKVELRDGNVSPRRQRSTVTIMRALLQSLNVHHLMEHIKIFLRHSEDAAVWIRC